MSDNMLCTHRKLIYRLLWLPTGCTCLFSMTFLAMTVQCIVWGFGHACWFCFLAALVLLVIFTVFFALFFCEYSLLKAVEDIVPSDKKQAVARMGKCCRCR